jgi:glycosyltransferase involved in cell wall biosynthesis/coenzyme F420-reducing hydrogenase beta subunit/polysaccharide pyruvyl transferase WcaK-like protein/lipopolysaccharide biosynthesis regulator YciM
MTQKKDITNIVKQGLCLSCGACHAVCGHHSIDFYETLSGHYYPKINYKTCVACAACSDVCPGTTFSESLKTAIADSHNLDPFIGHATAAYIGKAQNRDILRNSQSGGITTALLSHLFATETIRGALVVSMDAGNPPRPEARIITSAADLVTSQKSKYCQVPILCKLSELEAHNAPIAIVGLPCHMHGLANIIDKYPELSQQIVCRIGLCCDRVMTYGAIDYLIEKSRVNAAGKTLLTYRDTTRTGYPGDVSVVTESGDIRILPASARMSLKDFFTPARCRICFDKMNIFTDITVGDPHGIDRADKKTQESVVIVRTDNGMDLLNSAIQQDCIEAREIPYTDVINGQKIGKKKEQWRGYISAWQCLRNIVPNYTDTVSRFAAADNRTFYKQYLEYALSLDTYPSRKALFAHIDSLLYVNKEPVMPPSGKRVLIKGIGFINKGAELMLHAVLQKLSRTAPQTQFFLCGTMGGPVEIPPNKQHELANYDCTPGNMDDVAYDYVFDASGFAFGDQWGPERTIVMANAARRWKAHGTKVILLPQAFGPFENPHTRDAMRLLANHCDLIYARDPVSFAYLTDAVGTQPHIRLAPDFTMPVQGAHPADRANYQNAICIIPNYRMIDRTSKAMGVHYLSFLTRLIGYVLNSGNKPFILIHEGDDDYRLAQDISRTFDDNVPIIHIDNPLEAKGIIGACKGVVSSRFHGLVNALGQGVPSLAMGWSHKYAALFSDFGFPEGMVSIEEDDNTLVNKIDLLVDDARRSEVVTKIQRAGTHINKQIEEMWDSILELVARGEGHAGRYDSFQAAPAEADACDPMRTGAEHLVTEATAIASKRTYRMLHEQLTDKGWYNKKDLYATHLQKVDVINTQAAPSISVIVISWRLHPDTIKNFQILDQQRDQNYELIFVDNGGLPHEFDALLPFIDTRVTLNTNTGAYLARNIGALFAKAPILFFLEDDGIPERTIVEAHLRAHRTYDVLAVRGVSQPRSPNPLNELATQYYLGSKPIPYEGNLEGNISYRADVFYHVGGWDDSINFGHGGYELSMRLLAFDPNHGKQIYSPEPIIYHDYARDEQHLQEKRKKQVHSWQLLRQKHANWDSFINTWAEFRGRDELIIPRNSGTDWDSSRAPRTSTAVDSRASRKLNIAFLTNMLSNPSCGGGNVHVHQLAKHLLERGHRLYTNLTRESDDFIKWTDADFQSKGAAIDIFYIRIHGHPGNDELTSYRHCNPQAPCIWEINAPLEELITQGASPQQVVHLNSRRQELSKSVDAAVCVSAEMSTYAQQELGIRQTFTIPNGSDPEHFSPVTCNKNMFGGRFTVLWSGSPSFPWQGSGIVVEVAKKMRNIDSEIIFALTADGNSEGNLLYLGKIPYDRMPAYMASAEIGLCIYGNLDFYPEFYFSPLKMYDYMACGIPVIGSNLGQIGMTIRNNDCGVLTDGTVNDIISKILQLKNDSALARRIGTNGRNAVIQQHSWSNVAIRTEQAMFRLIDNQGEHITLQASVIICTYNRSALLAESLKSLIQQSFPSDRFEILVVDNNSTDNTREVTESFASNSPVSVRYIFEKEQGLSIARNTGIRNAKGEIIAFVDDDIHADENWLSAIVGAYEDPSVGCAGGPIRPIWLGQKPSWLDKMWEPYLTINEFEEARIAGQFRWPNTPWGANISFRKSVFDTIGRFPANLGRVGSSLLSNEEVNICKKIAAAGIKIRFAEAVIHHKIPVERLSKQWFYHRTFWQGRSDAILDSEGVNPELGIERRIINFLVAAQSLGGKSFSARCLKRIALGYLYQTKLPDNHISTRTSLNDYKSLLADFERLTQAKKSKTLLPSDNSRRHLSEQDSDKKTSILMISPLLPTFDRDSGSFRLFQIIRILAQQGHKITFIAMGAAGSFDARPYIEALTALGVRVYPLDPERLSEQIGKKVNGPRLDMERVLRETRFDIAYIYFYHTAALYLPLIRANSPHTAIIVDSVDFHFIRQKRNAELHNDAKLLEQAYQTRKQELLVYSLADTVIAVTEEDKKLLLTEKPDLTVRVIPNIHPLESVIPPCEGREGVLFIGNFFHDPNIDAVMYLCREIWPLVRLRLPDAKLYIVGNSPPEQIRNLAGNGIIVTGYVPDTGVYLRNCMVSVSPLRYGAGMKGKVGEALAAGIPVVASTVAAEGTGLTDRMHVHIADDPASFAAAVIYLHENNEYWNHLSRRGNSFIRENYTPDAVAETVLSLFARKEIQRQVSSRTASANAPDNPDTECVKVRFPESEENNVKLSGSSYCPDETFSTGTYNDLVRTLASLPDEEKIASIQQFIRTMPNSARAHNDLAVLYYQTGNKLQTLGHYEKAHRLAPNDSTIRKNIASFYFVEMGWTDDAIRIYTDLLKESPDDTEVLTALGIISTTLGRAEEAEIFLGKVVKLEPWNHEARNALSGLTDSLGSSGYVTSATESMQQPVSIDENLTQINSNLIHQANTKQDDDCEGAQKLLEKGRTEEAIALLENSLDNKHGDPVLHNDLGVLYQNIGNHQKSLEHYEIAVALSPGNPLFQKNLASFIYVLLGKTDEAVNMYTELLKNYPEDTEVLAALAIISSNNKRLEEACIFLKRILELEPENKDALFLMQQLDPGFAENSHLSSRLVEQACGTDETAARNDYRYCRKDNPPLVSIVILTFNQLDKTRDCVDSIRRHTSVLHEIIFVDNGSTDGTTAWLRELCTKNDNYTLIENIENKGFSAGCNQGIKAAFGEYVLLLNNDVIVTESWLDGLLECLRLMPNGGIAGPMTNNISGIQQVPGVQYESVEGLDTFALRFREINRHRRIPYRRIVGFCMLFRKSLIDTTGYLDESFGSGNFEDDDFCLRAELEGYRNVIAGDVFIHHVGSATFKGNNIDFTSAMTGNRKVFNDKWSRQVRNENEALKILALKTLEKAETLYQRGETDKAINTLLNEGISKASKENRFYFALAEYLIDQERFNDALDTLKELPESAERQRKNVLLGRALAGMGKLEEAENLAKSALLSDPSSAPALTLLGRIKYDSGRQQKAISNFEAAITADPGYGEPYTCLGMLTLQEDRLEDAVNLLEKGFLYLPLSAEAANHYHALITASGRFDRAENLFREMHSFYPQHRTLHFLLIDILIRQEKYQQAIAEVEQACTNLGIDDGMLAAGLDLRQKIGPLAIDPNRKKAGTSVSLCMIVKNEEKNLPRCLLSLKPIVDEIIIVDTGSTDRSRNLAALFGANVVDHPWNGDFSAARNVSLEQATGNWILVMDADEVIAPHDHEQFRQLLKISTGKNSAFEITTRNYMTKMNAEHWQANDGHYPEQEAGGGWIPSNKVRLFTNLKTIHFTNPIHELVDQSLAQARIPVRKSSIPVHHYGYLDKERQQEKGEQYYLLGIKKLAESGENDCTALSELAIQAGEIGRYAEAVELWSKVLGLAPDLPLAYFNLGFVYLQMGRFTESRDASAKAMKLKRNYYEAVNNYAMAELCLGNHDEAIKVLNKTLTEKPGYPNALAMLAVTRVYSNKKDEGLKLFRKLSDSGVVFVEFINESVKKLISAQRINEARTILDTALAHGYGNEKMHELNTSLQQG